MQLAAFNIVVIALNVLVVLLLIAIALLALWLVIAGALLPLYAVGRVRHRSTWMLPLVIWGHLGSRLLRGRRRPASRRPAGRA